jgi:hypothetical protein
MFNLHIICLLAINLAISPHDQSNQPIDSLKIPADNFSVDLLGNVYYTDKQALIKYKVGTEEKIEYANNFLGPIYSFDVSNPLKILVFHKNFNRIVFLDQSLAAMRSPVNLDKIGLTDVGACCSSHKGGFWIINNTSNQIQHYSSNLQLTQETPVLNELAELQNIKPGITEKNRQLYCHIPDCCILTFDRYGNLLNRYALKNVDNIQILDGNIYYFYKGAWIKQMGNKKETLSLPLPKGTHYWDNAKVGRQNQMYLLKNQKLYIYNR